MHRNILLWILAFILTIVSAVYQRVTGPTYPITGHTSLNGSSLEYKLLRSHGGQDDCRLAIPIPDRKITGTLYYKRLKVDEGWTGLEMLPEGDSLVGYLPHQPPAGKLRYYIKLRYRDREIRLPESNDVTIRFKGAVPAWAMIPHIIFMFGAMWVATRAGIQAIITDKNLKVYAWWSMILTFVGGLIFGPLVQGYAFGEPWTGVPFGIDLTDNKTLIAFLGWVVALIAVHKNKAPRTFVLCAALLMLIIFLIPHSVLGSELDYSTGEVRQAAAFMQRIGSG